MAAIRRLPALLTSLAIGLLLLSATLVAALGWPQAGVDDSRDEVLLARAVLLTPAGVALALLSLSLVIAAASRGNEGDDPRGA